MTNNKSYQMVNLPSMCRHIYNWNKVTCDVKHQILLTQHDNVQIFFLMGAVVV